MTNPKQADADEILDKFATHVLHDHSGSDVECGGKDDAKHALYEAVVARLPERHKLYMGYELYEARAYNEALDDTIKVIGEFFNE